MADLNFSLQEKNEMIKKNISHVKLSIHLRGGRQADRQSDRGKALREMEFTTNCMTFEEGLTEV